MVSVSLGRVLRWLAVAGGVCAVTPAAAYNLLGGKWEPLDGPVEYTISNVGSDDIQDDSETRAIQYAFRSWECVLCSNVQFRYMGDGPNEVASDGINAMFFLETAQLWQQQTGAGVESVLGVCVHHDTQTYSDADIAFNGTHTWSTTDDFPATDVESVALHESGHFAGLGHPCTDESETNCLPATEAVMAPAYPGGDHRTPLEDDRNGLCAIYPQTKDSCEGRKRLKEECERDCDCEGGMICVPDGDDKRMCSRPCGRASDPVCPRGTACALGGNSGGEIGICLRNVEGNKRVDGTICTRSGLDERCVSGTCERARAAGKLVCFHGCTADADCDFGYACMEGACLLPSVDRGVSCPSEDDDGGGCPGCIASRADGAAWLLLVAGLHVAARRRRRAG